MKEPVDHILRPGLPWRSSSITECGLDASTAKTITRDQYVARFKEMGQQRCSLFTCMTCSQTASRYATWEQDPRRALQREIDWEAGEHHWHTRDDRGQLLKDELLAIAALVEAHPEEFAEHIKATHARREWNARKAQMGRGHDA